MEFFLNGSEIQWIQGIWWITEAGIGVNLKIFSAVLAFCSLTQDIYFAYSGVMREPFLLSYFWLSILVPIQASLENLQMVVFLLNGIFNRYKLSHKWHSFVLL